MSAFADTSTGFARFLAIGLMLSLAAGCTPLASFVVHEQRSLAIREPDQIPTAPLPKIAAPPTVLAPTITGKTMEISLDDAIRIALANTKVVRVLAGTSATSSGRTIYDPAVVNTSVDVAKAAFDPVVTAKNFFTRGESPQAFFAANPTGAAIAGTRIDNYELGLGISKKSVTGGTVSLDGSLVSSRFEPGPAPLNPQERGSLTMSYTQPLLQGAGPAVNLAPIVIARINTERSYFQLKDSTQELVRGVVEAYWQMVFARTDVWARKQQVEQSDHFHKRAEARLKVGLGTKGEAAQAQVSLLNFRAGLVAAEANLLQREAALRNLLGLPPEEPERFVPITPPTPVRLDPKWDEIVKLAQEMRPDLIELALVLEADQQSIVQAKNLALPKLDATMFYRWNGLEGDTPTGTRISTGPGQFADWSMGVNFSVPLGLRQGRAQLRNAELVLMTDRANLEQGLHSATHALAANMRNLAQYHQQYKTFHDMRVAARINLEQQFSRYTSGSGIFLEVLQAMTDWGNAVSSEAQSLALYNTELANLERQTGTILESHGIRFAEERAGFIGPLGRLGHRREYPSAVSPAPNALRYPDRGEQLEKVLEKDVPSFKEPLKKVPPPPPPKKDAPPPAAKQAEPPPRPPTFAPARLGAPQNP
jgi:outer membrane protein TolC